jgi:hypothetical protein
MATEKFLNTKIKLRYDLYSNWATNNPKLLAGEVALAYIPTGENNSVSVGEGKVNGTTPPQVLIKVGDGEHQYNDLKYVSALAADVLAACKSEEGLKTFINGVIADAGIATSEAMEALAGRVTKLEADENTEGSVAKAIKDAIDALNLDTTYVAIEEGKSLVDDDEITKLAGVSEGANKVEASTNGNIKIDGVDTVVYTHPDKHAIAEVDGLQDALNGLQTKGDYAAEVHTHVKEDITDFAHTHTASEVTDFATEVAKVKVENATNADVATKATQDGNGDVIADTYAKQATTYTKDEVDDEIEGAINTFVSAYITSDGGAIDKLQEIANWIDSDANGAADIIADVEANAEGIENLGGRMDAVEDELETYGDIVTHNVAEFYTKEQADAAFTDSTEVDGQIDAKITALVNEGQVKTNQEAIEAINDETTGILAQAKTDAANKDIAILAEAQAYADQAEADAIADAAGKYETKGTAQGIVDALDLANTYQAKGEYATAEQGGKADTAIQSVTSIAGNGIKATTSGTAVTIDWDPEIVFVFDCGTSEE